MKILIVDDEPLVRMGIKALFEKVCDDSLMLYETANGALAKEILLGTEIDIVLTDIKMPRMDGIELTKWIKSNMAHIVVIILSNYNDFDFVRQAMKFGASDYMLKYAIDENTVKKILNEYMEDMRMVEKDEKDENNALKQLVLKELILEGDISLYDQYNKSIDLNFEDKTKTFICLKINHYQRILRSKYNNDKHALDIPLKSLLLEKLDKDLKAKLFLDNEGRYMAIVEHDDDKDILAILKTVLFSVNKYMGIEMNIGYSSSFIKMAHVSLAKKEAENALAKCFFAHEDQNILLGEYKIEKKIPDDEYTKKVIEKCKELFSENNLDGFCRYMNTIMAYISQHGNDVERVIGMAGGIVDQYKIARLKYVDSDEILLFFEDISSELKDVESITDVEKVLSMIVNRKTYFIKNMMKPGSYDIIINRAIEYINNNYCSNSLNLVEAAEKVNVNPTYLSRIFKEKTGKSFITYVTELRMEQAKELLKVKKMLIKEVCFEVGYENYNHFCKTFKKHTGKSPSDFR